MKAKVYTKGQVIIPREFRIHFDIKPGDYVEVEEEKKFVKIIPTGKSILELAGSLKSNKKNKNDIEKATILQAKEVAGEGKDN